MGGAVFLPCYLHRGKLWGNAKEYSNYHTIALISHVSKVKESESEVAQSCWTLCDPMDCSLPGSSLHGILQARILEWVAISFSRESSWPRDGTQVSSIPGRRFNHMSVMLKILQARLQQYMNCELPDVYSGLRKGREARDQTANIHWIIEKAREFQKNTYFCFINYTKAFDCVDHNELWKILRDRNTKPPELPPEKSVCGSGSKS